MPPLTRDAILALRAALPTQHVEVAGLGAVTIRMLTLKEVGAIQARQQAHAGEPLKVYPELLRAACVDGSGRPLFDPGDGDLIDGLPWPAVNALALAILKFNKMAGDDADPKAGGPSAGPSGSS